MDFWRSLCCQFEVNEQLTSLINILNFLLQLPDDKDDGKRKSFYLMKAAAFIPEVLASSAAAVKHVVGRRGAKKKEEEEKMEELIFSVESHSSKELRHLKFISVSFMAQLLCSASFIEKVSDSTAVMSQQAIRT